MLQAKLYVSTILSPMGIWRSVHCIRRGGGRDGGGLGIRRIEGEGTGGWTWDGFKKRGREAIRTKVTWTSYFGIPTPTAAKFSAFLALHHPCLCPLSYIFHRSWTVETRSWAKLLVTLKCRVQRMYNNLSILPNCSFTAALLALSRLVAQYKAVHSV